MDSEDFERGGNWRLGAISALRRTAKLLVVLTPDAFKSDAVAFEVKSFSQRKKQIIPIAVNGSLEDFGDKGLMKYITRENIFVAEKTFRTSDQPSELVVSEIDKSFNITKQISWRFRIATVALMSLSILAVSLAVAAYYANIQRVEANEQRREAERKQLIALNNESAALTALASNAVDEQRPTIAAKLALAAWPRNAEDPRPQLAATQKLFSEIAPLQREQIDVHSLVGSVAKVYFVGEDSRILSFSGGGIGSLVDGLTGVPVAEIEGQGERVQFSHDNAYFATVLEDNHSVGVWDAVTGKQVAVLTHTMPVFGLRINHDGSRVLTTTGEQFARLWATKTQSLVRELKRHQLVAAHQDSVVGVRFTPTGTRAVTVSESSVILWDGLNGNMIEELLESDGVEFIYSSPDGTRFLATQLDGSSPVIYDAMTGQREPSLRNPVEDAVFVPEANRLIAWRAGKIHLFDAKERKRGASIPALRRPLTGSSWVADVESRVVSDDGRRFLTWESDRIVRVRSTATGDVVAETKAHQGNIVRADFGTGGDDLWVQTSDNQLHLWDAASGFHRAVFRNPSEGSALLGFAVSEYHERLLTWSDNGSVRIWDTKAQTPQSSVLADGFVRSATLNPAKDQALVAIGDYTVLIDLVTGEEIERFKTVRSRVEEARFSPDGSRILVKEYASSNALLWNSSTRKQVASLGNAEFRLSKFEFNPKRPEILALASRDHGARIYSSLDGSILKSFSGYVRDGIFNPQGTRILMTHRSSDGVLYNANTADVVEIIPGRVRGGHFSDDGSILLVWWSNLDDRLKNTAKIYNAETGQEQAVFLGHAKRVLGGRITPDSTRALTWSLGGDLQLWDASDGSLVHAFQGHRQSVKGVVFAPNGERFLTWSSDGTIRLWDLENGEELGILYQTGAESGILSAPVFSEDGRYITVRADGVVSKI